MKKRYASAVTEVSPIAIATLFAPPVSSSSSTSMNAVSPYTTASVPTTFSLAINPVIAAAASCQTPNPRGISSMANGDAIDASMEVFSAPSSTTLKLQSKLCITCTTVLQIRMMVAALMI